MRKFFKRTINHPIILTVYFFLFIIIILTGAKVIYNGKDVIRTYDNIIDSSISKLKLLRQIRENALQVQIASIHTALGPFSPNLGSQELAQKLEQVKLNFNDLKNILSSRQEKQAFSDLFIAWQQNEAARNKLISLSANQKEASAYYASTEKKTYVNLYNELSAFLSFLFDNIVRMDESADNDQVHSQVTTSILLGLVIVLLMILGFFVVKTEGKLKKNHLQLIMKDKALFESKNLYKELFNESPLPKWVCDKKTLQFYEVNDAAIKHYGYTREEFLKLSIYDLRPEDDHYTIRQFVESNHPITGFPSRRHIKKNGEIIWVEVALNDIIYRGKEYVLTVVTDVTEKLKAEQRLLESEANMRAILENTNTAFYLMDTDFNLLAFNQLSYEWTLDQTGKKLEKGRSFAEYVHPERREPLQRLYEKTLTGEKVNLEIEGYKDNRWYQVNIKRIIGAADAVIGLCVSSVDITEEKIAEQKVKDSEELYRSLFHESPLPIIICDTESLRILEVSDMAIELYGYSREEFLDLTIFNLRPQESHSYLEEIISSGCIKTSKLTGQHLKKNGKKMMLDIALDTIHFNGVDAYLAVFNDITKTHQLEQELTEEKLNKQKDITKATIHGQETERDELGKELHDNVNQILASAKLYLESAMSMPDKKEEFIAKGKELVNCSINEIRKVSKSLVKPSLGDLTLAETLRELAIPLKLIKKKIHFKIKLKEDELNNDLKISIYRMVQEQLNNIIKYAEATDITVNLVQSNNELKLVIADNGKGFDMNKKRHGIGITNIINRASIFNGVVSIDSSPGNGCRVEVNFALHVNKCMEKVGEAA